MREPKLEQVVLVRHGETEWSREGRHTGSTDLPLTEDGLQEAKRVAETLAPERATFTRIFTSPLKRATETCRLAGFANEAEIRPELKEWNYGDYEGLTTAQIVADRPHWSLWRDGAPSGDQAGDVGLRVDRMLEDIRAASGAVLIFAHGHLLRVLTARWLDLPPDRGRCFSLSTAAISRLGFEHHGPVIKLWNSVSHL